VDSSSARRARWPPSPWPRPAGPRRGHPGGSATSASPGRGTGHISARRSAQSSSGRHPGQHLTVRLARASPRKPICRRRSRCVSPFRDIPAGRSPRLNAIRGWPCGRSTCA
jgi:hypothetical protein